MSSIVRTIAPVFSPLDLEALANYLRVDAQEDVTHLEHLAAQAADEVERLTGRVLLSSTYRLSQDNWPTDAIGYYLRAIELPRTPLLTVTSVKYYDEADVLQTLDSAQYIVCTDSEIGQVYLKAAYTWPDLSERPDAVQVLFTAGHATQVSEVPARLKMAMLLLCRYYYAGGTPNDRIEKADDYEKAMDILAGQKVGGWVQ